MLSLGDLDEHLHIGLSLDIRAADGAGLVTYDVAPPSAPLGLWFQRMFTVGLQYHAASTDEQIAAVAARIAALPPPGVDPDTPLEQLTLGAAYDQMVANGVSSPKVKFAGWTAFLWITAGEDAARQYWTTGGTGKAAAPNRAERRKTSTSTAAEPKTRTRASTSGTTSRTTGNRARTKANRSTGTTS